MHCFSIISHMRDMPESDHDHKVAKGQNMLLQLLAFYNHYAGQPSLGSTLN